MTSASNKATNLWNRYRNSLTFSRLFLLNVKSYTYGSFAFCSSYPVQSTVTKQYKFGTSVSWEGNRRSSVALAMNTTYGLTALGREKSTPPKLQQEYGTLYFTFITKFQCQ